MRTHCKTRLLSCILFAVLLSGCTGKEQTPQNRDSESNTQPTDQTETDNGSLDAVSFEARTLDGTSVSADLFSQSRITMVNVWATYCGPCLSEMPGLGELAGAYDPDDFQLIGIVSDVTEDAGENALQYASDLVSETGADYPHLLLNESVSLALLTDVSAVPTTFFINQDGQILDTVIGAMDKSAWEEKIDAFLE